MKTILAFVLTLATLSTASPTVKRGCGTPGVYQCSAAHDTMEVCDFDQNWKRLEPICPSGTECQSNPFGNGIPYCMVKIPDPVITGGLGSTCTVASKYTCTPDNKAIQICDLSLHQVLVGGCPNHCAYIAGIPYCF